MDYRGRMPPFNSCPWLHLTFCFVPLFLSIKVRAGCISSRVLLAKLNQHPQRSGPTVTNYGGNQSSPVLGFFLLHDEHQIPQNGKCVKITHGSYVITHVYRPSLKITAPFWELVHSIMLSGSSPAPGLLVLLAFPFFSWSRHQPPCESTFSFFAHLCVRLHPANDWAVKSFLPSTFPPSSLKYVLYSRSDRSDW